MVLIMTTANGEDLGEFCAIPKLQRGVVTTVDVPYIEKPFCGTALIDHHYVRMESFAKVTEVEEPRCLSDDVCTRVYRFYTDEAKTTAPYTLVVRGPRRPRVS